jgi:ribonuclease R
MIGDRTGTAYKLGDIVPVRLAEAAPLTGGLRFELTEEAPSKSVQSFKAKPRFEKKRGRRR